MGLSKKKSKNIKKAQARVGAKAKQKVRDARKIQGREAIKDSKRKAAEATGARKKDGAGKDDDFKEINSVDALFASMEDEDAASDATGVRSGGGDDSSDGESSAGAFHDVDDGAEDDAPIRGVVEDLEEDEELGPDAAARHEKELRAIKEKDPEFYKFLVEQDKSLLDFRAPPGEEEDDEGEGEKGEEGEEGVEGGEGAEDKGLQGKDLAGEAADSQGKVLTKERLQRIQASAKDSFTACKAALNVYHTAVRSIERQQEEAPGFDGEDDGDDGEGKGKKSKKQADRKRRGVFRIEDEAIFSEVIEWSISNMLGLFKHHAGELRPEASSSTGGKKKGRKGKKDNGASDPSSASSGPLDPTRYKRWTRVRVLTNIFWEETFFLLNHLVAQEMLEYVLRNCSSPDALAWLWPFKSVRQRYVRRCCSLWSTGKSQNVRLLAFLFIRNSAAMVMHMPDSKDKQVPQLEQLLRQVIRNFAEVAGWGYSWKSLSTFRFMENCIIELLRLEDATAYRLGYVCLRQLALILRNACLATSQVGKTSGGGAAGEGSEKAKKKKSQAQQQTQVLLAWPFVRAISLWTRAVGAVPALRPLAYPLSMITMGAVKHKLTSLQHFPFVYHCLFSLSRLGSSLEAFVPISSHLLKVFDVLVQAIDKTYKKGGKGGEKKTLDSSVKAPELEIVLRLSEAQLGSSLALEAVGSSLCFLFIDHLGLLSQSPAFPEIIAPVMMHLRKFSKHCRSEPLRRQLKSLVEKAEATADSVRVRREALTEAPDGKKFLLFEADNAIAKARAEATRRRAAEEKSRVEAELRAAASGDGAGAAAGSASGDLSLEDGDGEGKKGKKRKKGQKAEEEAPSKDKKRKKRKRTAGEEARAAGALPDRDKVEEMGFSSGEED